MEAKDVNGDTLPDWLKTSITLERLVMNMRALKGEEMTGTDTEACAYLYTVSLTQPLDHDWAQIYLFLSTWVVRRNRKTDIPQDIAVEGLSDYHMGELRRLKECLILKKARGQPNPPSWECCCPRYDSIVSVIISLVKCFSRFIDILWLPKTTT